MRAQGGMLGYLGGGFWRMGGSCESRCCTGDVRRLHKITTILAYSVRETINRAYSYRLFIDIHFWLSCSDTRLAALALLPSFIFHHPRLRSHIILMSTNKSIPHHLPFLPLHLNIRVPRFFLRFFLRLFEVLRIIHESIEPRPSLPPLHSTRCQIGRASCRERVF